MEIINSDTKLQERVKAYNAYRTSFKVERNLSAFLDKTGEMELFIRQLLELNPSDKEIQEAWVDSKINYARAVWTEHMNAEARIILDDIILSKLGFWLTKSSSLMDLWGCYISKAKKQELAIKKFEQAFKISSLNLRARRKYFLVTDLDSLSD